MLSVPLHITWVLLMCAVMFDAMRRPWRDVCDDDCTPAMVPAIAV